MYQVTGQGKPPQVNFEECPKSTRSDIPLGLKISDGRNAYRWGHVKESTYYPGMPVVQNTDSSIVTMVGSYFKCRAYDGGDLAGSLYIYLYSATSMIANKFEDGHIAFVSSTGRGHIYGIEGYEVGAAGSRTRVKLKQPLYAAIGAGTQMRAIANKYYGCLTANNDNRIFSADDELPIGAITASDGAISNTSGYQWLQVAGVGPCFHSGHVISTGMPLGVYAAAVMGPACHLSSDKTIAASAAYNVVARSLVAQDATDDFGVCEWFIETP